MDVEKEHQGRPGELLNRVILATRKSPLALVQAELAAAQLRSALGVEAELLRIVTTGDKQARWSLEAKGGKGLFTGELEQALLRGDADLAIHSTKDLPGEATPGLVVAGYLPRADPRDVLVLRAGIEAPTRIGTGSARRRMQIAALFPTAEFCEIRGNVDTRLKKVAAGDGGTDATLLAAAGLARLGIGGWPGLDFHPLSFGQMVPAVGQGAIALQCRTAEAGRFAAVLDAATGRNVAIERALQAAMGAGCHTAVGAHAAGDTLYLFHEAVGQRALPLSANDFADPAAAAIRILRQLGLK
jgi:hydroxymethylbilane synthase